MHQSISTIQLTNIQPSIHLNIFATKWWFHSVCIEVFLLPGKEPVTLFYTPYMCFPFCMLNLFLQLECKRSSTCSSTCRKWKRSCMQLPLMYYAHLVQSFAHWRLMLFSWECMCINIKWWTEHLLKCQKCRWCLELLCCKICMDLNKNACVENMQKTKINILSVGSLSDVKCNFAATVFFLKKWKGMSASISTRRSQWRFFFYVTKLNPLD